MIFSLFRRTPKRVVKEVEWCKRIAPCVAAVCEHRLFDGTRVDLLTAHHAVEVDWAEKWAEAVGQALYYGRATGRKPVVLLLLSDEKDRVKFVSRAEYVAAGTFPGIEVWTLDTTEVEPKLRTPEVTIPIG